jgi:hypothetical protein
MVSGSKADYCGTAGQPITFDLLTCDSLPNRDGLKLWLDHISATH